VKINPIIRLWLCPAVVTLTLVLAMVGLSLPVRGQQIYVANYNYNAGNGGSSVGEYNLDGSPVNASLITGLTLAEGLTVSGNDLFVANLGQLNSFGSVIASSGSIGEYDLNGSPVNTALITGLNLAGGLYASGNNLFIGEESGPLSEYTTSGGQISAKLLPGTVSPWGIAISGSYLFVADFSKGVIGEYTTSGAVVNASLVTGLSSPQGLVMSGNNLYVAVSGSGVIGEYTLGATPGTISSSQPSLVTGLDYPIGLALNGNDLYVANYKGGTVGEYTTSGDTVNASLITTGPLGPMGITIAMPAPEPGTLMLLGLGGLMALRRTRPGPARD
jgi:PEP-CTERM motif